MAGQMPCAGLSIMHRLARLTSSTAVPHVHRGGFGKHTSSKMQIRAFLTAGVRYNENDKNSSDPATPNLTSRQALLSRRRRPLSPLERISSLLPEDALSPEVLQLREQQSEREPDTPKEQSPPEEPPAIPTQDEIPGVQSADDSDSHHASATLPQERLLAYGELLVAEYRKNTRMEYRKMFQLQEGARLMSNWGIIQHHDITTQQAGCYLKTSRGVSIFIRRPSLEDYTLYMKRGPAIAYPKDAAIMLMMMDVTEGDNVLESGSGSGAMSLFLSRAVGSKGSVVSVEVREDHYKRAVLNYERWRTSWGLRRGEEWPDNVQFHHADLCRAPSLLAGQGFHAIALDMIDPHLALPTVVPHLHPGGVCAVYLASITQVTDLLEGLRCASLPLLCERIIEVPVRDWLVAPARQKDGQYHTRKALNPDDSQKEEEEEEEDTSDETCKEEQPAFGLIPYVARPHPVQMSHTAFLVKLRKHVR